MKTLFLFLTILVSSTCFSQSSYKDSIAAYLKNYVQTHQVVKGHNREHMQFYEVDKAYKVAANFEAATKTDWFTFKTSGKQSKVYKLYGTLSFLIGKVACSLNLYQSQDLMENETYKNYLFLPFTDATTGTETYASGRYLDLFTTDINNGMTTLDFNKAYNPYCAYVSGVYNCPIPPKENTLPVAIKAGEKNFSSGH